MGMLELSSTTTSLARGDRMFVMATVALCGAISLRHQILGGSTTGRVSSVHIRPRMASFSE